MSRLVRGATEVRWARGALLVRYPPGAVLVDAPPGIEDELGDALPTLAAVFLTSGRIRATGGLLGLLSALEPHRSPERVLPLHVPWAEERGSALAELWSRGWPGRFPVEVDAQRAGATVDVSGIEVTTAPLRAGEPTWHPGSVVPVPALGVRLRTPDLTVALLPASTPSTAGRRLCEGADLAIVEVGVAPWPRPAEGDPAWRPTAEQAIALSSGAGESWLVGDDGRWLGDESPV